MHKDRLPDVDAFLEELTALSHKYKLQLWAPEQYGGMQIIPHGNPGAYEYQVFVNMEDNTEVKVSRICAKQTGLW